MLHAPRDTSRGGKECPFSCPSGRCLGCEQGALPPTSPHSVEPTFRRAGEVLHHCHGTRLHPWVLKHGRVLPCVDSATYRVPILQTTLKHNGKQVPHRAADPGRLTHPPAPDLPVMSLPPSCAPWGSCAVSDPASRSGSTPCPCLSFPQGPLPSLQIRTFKTHRAPWPVWFSS